eukprot:678903-Amphidinium_carterae.1
MSCVCSIKTSLRTRPNYPIGSKRVAATKDDPTNRVAGHSRHKWFRIPPDPKSSQKAGGANAT